MTDLLGMLKHELRNVPGGISAAATAMCKVVWHQFQITWQAQGDQQKAITELERRVRMLEKRLQEDDQ